LRIKDTPTKKVNLLCSQVCFRSFVRGNLFNPASCLQNDSSIITPQSLFNHQSSITLSIMTPTIRAQRIQLKNMWCMKCLRSSCKSFDPTVTSASFSIRCFLNEEGSKKCEQCIKRRDLCLRPSEGMWGDANDLVAILEWIAWMFTPDNAYLALDGAFLESVNDATLKLVNDFEHAHQAHESVHGLGGSVKKDVSRVSDCGVEGFAG
jgi:hypothetical protein